MWKITVPHQKVHVYLIPETEPAAIILPMMILRMQQFFYFVKRIIQISFHNNFKDDGVGFYMIPTFFFTNNLFYSEALHNFGLNLRTLDDSKHYKSWNITLHDIQLLFSIFDVF